VIKRKKRQHKWEDGGKHLKEQGSKRRKEKNMVSKGRSRWGKERGTHIKALRSPGQQQKASGTVSPKRSNQNIATKQRKTTATILLTKKKIIPRKKTSTFQAEKETGLKKQ